MSKISDCVISTEYELAWREVHAMAGNDYPFDVPHIGPLRVLDIPSFICRYVNIFYLSINKIWTTVYFGCLIYIHIKEIYFAC